MNPPWHGRAISGPTIPSRILPAWSRPNGFGLATSHPYRDGNKRIAFLAMVIFLGLNDWDLDALEAEVVAEIFRDFVFLSRRALTEGVKEVAAVLAAAALEDALKRYARANGLDVEDKAMQEVVSALRAKGLVGGAQEALLEVMPKLRDYAMHANWDKFTEAEVNPNALRPPFGRR